MPEHLWGMTTIPTRLDDSLAGAVAQATAGDQTAFTRIVRAHHDDMTRVCFVICGDLDLADEAVGAAWPIAWRKLSTLKDPDRLRPWLVSVAANEARQLLRRQRRRTVVELSVGRSRCRRCRRTRGPGRRPRPRQRPRPARPRRPDAPRPALCRGLRLDRTCPGDRALPIRHACSPGAPARPPPNGAPR